MAQPDVWMSSQLNCCFHHGKAPLTFQKRLPGAEQRCRWATQQLSLRQSTPLLFCLTSDRDMKSFSWILCFTCLKYHHGKLETAAEMQMLACTGAGLTETLNEP